MAKSQPAASIALALLIIFPLAGHQGLRAQTATSPRPVIDVHLHAFPVARFRPGAIDPAVGTREFGFQVAASDEAHLEATLTALREHQVVKAIVSGPLALVRTWTIPTS